VSSEDIKITLEVINTLAIVIASEIASIAAIWGFSVWRKEFQGKRNIELAEEVLALFYEAKDAIRAIRRPPIFQGEGSTRKPQEEETSQEKQARDDAYVFYKRFDKRREVFNKLHSERYQFMARFGREEAKPFEDLKNLVIEIQCATDVLAELRCEIPYSQKDKKRLQEQIKEQEKICWYHGKSDPITLQVEKVISNIEEICRPIIIGKNKL